MEHKTVLVTGANSGLGLACSRELLHRGYKLIMACRSMDKANAAREQLLAQTKVSDANIKLLNLDLASQENVRAAAEKVPRKLFGLVCNAGMSYPGPPRFTVDGIEETFAVNHLGHFLLVLRLLHNCPELKRIAVVSSAAHDPNEPGPFPDPDLSDLNLLPHPPTDPVKGKVGSFRYSNSKLCNLLFMFELHRRLQEQGRNDLLVNAFNPGLVPGTGLGKEESWFMRFAWYYVMPALSRLIKAIRRPEQAGADLADLITKVKSSGNYWDQGRMGEPSAQSQDPELAAELWRRSLEWTGLAPTDGI